MYDRDGLLAAVDLPALADELLGDHAGTQRTPTWSCPDPGHSQTGRTPPVTAFTSRRGEQRWRCHACGAGGTAIDLVMVCCKVDVRGAMEELAQRTGQRSQEERTSAVPRRPRPRPAPQPVGCTDPDGMNRYAASCAQALFTADGRSHLAWLTRRRGLSEGVLRANQIGADLGPRRQPRPAGMPRVGGIVLPVIHEGAAVYAQIRIPHPRADGPRYLNPSGDLASNPRLARFRPAEREHREIIVTEGAIDALSANVAGFRSVAVLSAAYPDRLIAHELSRLPHPLVLAFDQDDAGQAAADRLASLLDAQQRRPVRLPIGAADLNDALVQSSNWERELRLRTNAAIGSHQPGLSRTVA